MNFLKGTIWKWCNWSVIYFSNTNAVKNVPVYYTLNISNVSNMKQRPVAPFELPLAPFYEINCISDMVFAVLSQLWLRNLPK